MKNIVFDLGGVVLKDSASSVLTDVAPEIFEQLKIFFCDWDEMDLGMERLIDKYNKCNFPAEIDLLYKEKMIHYYLYREINMDLIKLMGLLKEKNYGVYVLSDNNYDASLYYQSSDLFKNVDGWVMSCDYHTLKKDGILFDIFIDKYKLDPNECYFIDDKKGNIEEAKKHNIYGFVFNGDLDLLYKDMRNNYIDI